MKIRVILEQVTEETLKLAVPAHRPGERSTLAHIIKQAPPTPEAFDEWL